MEMSQKSEDKVIVSMGPLLTRLKDSGVDISYEDAKRLGVNGVIDIIKKTLKS